MLLVGELLLPGLDPVEGTVVSNARRELLAGLAGTPGNTTFGPGRPGFRL